MDLEYIINPIIPKHTDNDNLSPDSHKCLFLWIQEAELQVYFFSLLTTFKLQKFYLLLFHMSVHTSIQAEIGLISWNVVRDDGEPLATLWELSLVLQVLRHQFCDMQLAERSLLCTNGN